MHATTPLKPAWSARNARKYCHFGFGVHGHVCPLLRLFNKQKKALLFSGILHSAEGTRLLLVYFGGQPTQHDCRQSLRFTFFKRIFFFGK